MDKQPQSVKLTCSNHTQLLLDGMWVKYEQKQETDLYIEVSTDSGIDPLQVHRLPLSIVAPHFLEKFQNYRFVLDFDRYTIASILEFIYRGQVDVCEDNLEELSKAAEALGIDLLLSAINEVRNTVKPEENASTILTNKCNKRTNFLQNDASERRKDREKSADKSSLTGIKSELNFSESKDECFTENIEIVYSSDDECEVEYHLPHLETRVQISEASFVQSQKKGNLLVHLGYTFRKERARANKILWKCIDYSRKHQGRQINCKGRCHTYNGVVIFHSDNHNHEPDLPEMQKKLLLDQMRQRAGAESLNSSEENSDSDVGNEDKDSKYEEDMEVVNSDDDCQVFKNEMSKVKKSKKAINCVLCEYETEKQETYAEHLASEHQLDESQICVKVSKASFVQSQKKANHLVHLGYTFRKERGSTDKIIWKCIEYYRKRQGRQMSCRGRCHTLNGVVIFHSDNHNHQPDMPEVRKKLLLDQMKQRALDITKSPREIIIASPVDGNSSVQAKLPSLSGLRKVIQRARKAENMISPSLTNNQRDVT